jgi:hypothetical protein
MANTPQFTMRLDPAVRSELEAIAARENRTLSNLIDSWLRERLATTKRRGKSQ